MEWYRKLYLSEGLESKRDKLISQIEKGAGTRRFSEIYVITLPTNEKNLLDIFVSDLLLQPVMHGLCPMIVGLAKGYDDAVEIATSIILDTYDTQQNFDVYSYLEKRISDGKGIAFRYPMEKLKPRKRFSIFHKKKRT